MRWSEIAVVTLVVSIAATARGEIEFCDGLDDDGDGQADEGFGCVRGAEEPCEAPRGVQGVRRCSPACTWTTCGPIVEMCDGVDNDGDGTADEEYECSPGQRRACDDGRGHQTCLSDCQYGACVVAERCNHRDDDSDGRVDEGLPYGITATTQEIVRPGAYFYMFDDMACTPDRALVLVETTDGLNSLMFDADGRRLGGAPVLCHRLDRLDIRDDEAGTRYQNPIGGQGLAVGDHFLASCIGWPTPEAYAPDSTPHLLIFKVGRDGVVEGPTADIPPRRMGRDLYAPGPADMDLSGEEVILVWAETIGPRGPGQPADAPVFLYSQRLDLDGRLLGEAAPLDAVPAGDTRAAFRVRHDERGPVLFVREPAQAPNDESARSFWRYRLDPESGRLSERFEGLPNVPVAQVLERFAGGWGGVFNLGAVALYEDDGRLRWPRSQHSLPWVPPYGRARGAVVGDELIYADLDITIGRLSSSGAKSQENERAPPPLPIGGELPREWHTWAYFGCASPDGVVTSLAVFTGLGSFRDPVTPQLIEFARLECRD